MAEKRKFSDGKTFGRPKFRTEKFSDKKKPRKFFRPKVFILNVGQKLTFTQIGRKKIMLTTIDR